MLNILSLNSEEYSSNEPQVQLEQIKKDVFCLVLLGRL